MLVRLLFLTCVALLAADQRASAQGTVNFNNRVTTGAGAQGAIITHVYGPDPADPTVRKTGNSASDNPPGSQIYSGALLAGTGFTVQLWGIGGVTTDMNALLLADNGTTSFRTGSGAGFIAPLADAAVIRSAPAGAGSRATLQLRVWDNQGGTITSWSQAIGSLTAKGYSDLFTPNFDLGGGAVLPPNLIGLTSFAIMPAPEPSGFAFGIVASLGFLLRCHSKRK